jgi:thioredoxin-like negative regulator of GroEL
VYRKIDGVVYVTDLYDSDFEKSLEKGTFLFMFYTDWCPLCPIIIERLIELERQEAGGFVFAKIDYDKNPEAVEYWGAIGVPLVLAVLDGRPLYGCAGLLIQEGYRQIVRELLYGFNEALLDEKIKKLEELVDKLMWEQIDEEPI